MFRPRLAALLLVLVCFGLGTVTYFFSMAPSAASQSALVLADSSFLLQLHRALLVFTHYHPQYEIALAEAPSDYQGVLRRGEAHLAIVQGAEDGPVLFYSPVLLAVAPLDTRENVTLARARQLVQGYDPMGELQLVSLDSVHSRGFMKPGEVTPIDYGQRAAWLRALMVDGAVPDYENVRSGRYPLTTPAVAKRPQGWLWRYFKKESEAARAFLDFLESPRGQEALYGHEPEIVFIALGDVMLARHVATKMKEHGLDYPFARVKDLLASGDLVFANLESPLGVKGTPIPNKLIWFRGPPEGASVLRNAGVHVVSLANNHILDYDSENLIETLELLDQHEIAWTGAGRDLQEARRPAILKIDGVTVAFLAYTEFASANLFWSYQYPRTFLAGPGVPGCAPMDLSMVTEDVARARNQADVVVVSYHWGQEYVNHPQSFMGQDLQEVARRTIDAGADMVLGHHPHAIQGIEIYRGSIIAYSLGNFVMDQTRPVTTESMMLRIGLSKSGARSLQVLPVRISEHRPALATGDDAKYIMDKIRAISLPLYPQPAELQHR